MQSREEEIIDLVEYGLSEKDIEEIKAGDTEALDEISKDYFYETKQPEWGYEIVGS